MTRSPRTAFAVLWNRADNQTWEGVVDLTGDAVVSWTHVPGVTPNFTVDEYHEVDEAMRAHPDVIAALAERGITDMSLVMIEVWTYGKALMPEQWRDRRLGWCDIWYRETPDGQPLRAPGVRPEGRRRREHAGAARARERPRPRSARRSNAEYVPGPWTGELRTDLRPLQITQPEGRVVHRRGHRASNTLNEASNGLGSTGSAADRSALFVGFTATMAGSDFSCPCIIGYGSSPSRCGPAAATPTPARQEISQLPMRSFCT